MRLVVVALNLVAGVLTGMAVLTIMGPDLGTPRRGVTFDALWLAFHVGPCAALASLALVGKRFGSRLLPVSLVAITLAITAPGVLMARSDAASPQNHSPGHGMLTFLVVCAQYAAVGIVWAVVIAAWVVRRRGRYEV